MFSIENFHRSDYPDALRGYPNRLACAPSGSLGC
jgi:hypothetical protein